MCASRWTAAKRRRTSRVSRRFGLIELLEARTVLAGEFTDLGNLGLTGVISTSAAWGDYDNDGDLDVLLSGRDQTNNRVSIVFQNNNGNFTDISANLTEVDTSSVAWGDYDNDGDLDILLTGRIINTGSSVALIYRNNGNGTFTDIAAGLTGARYSSAAWGDYDNDGDLDVLISGRTGTGNATNTIKIYRNEGNGGFTDISATLPSVAFGSVAWGDFDNDGDLDILISGTSSTSSRVTSVWRNDGNNVFVDINAGLLPLNNSSVSWGDYDNDGDLDILIAGQDSGGQPHSIVYRNNSNGTFTNINAPLTGVFYGSVAWGDYDNDGDLDILLTGRTSSTARISQVYRNDNGTFSNSTAALTGTDLNSVAWGDYDNDGDLDILLAGRDSGSGLIARVFRNNATTANTAPSAPTGLTSTIVTGTSVTFAWTAATDTQTPSLGLNYNLRVGTTPGGSDVFSTMANTTTGLQRIPNAGPIQGTSYTLQGLTQGVTYYWSVQAIDTAFAGSLFAAEQSFVPAASPSVTAPTVTNVTSNSATLGGNVTADNGAAITERGVLLAKTSVNNNPQLNGNGVTKLTATGTTGVFTVDALGLDFTTGYSYVAFATNASGTTYTTVETFTTLATTATLMTPSATNITSTNASISGSMPNTGGSPVTSFGYVYAKTTDDPTPQLGESNVSQVVVTSLTINSDAIFLGSLLSGLQPGTQYSLSTYAINAVGTSYSTTITFTTLAAAPTVTTPTQANITANSATLGGNVTADNGAAITERGILVSKTSVNNNPQLNGNGVTKIVATGTTGVFTVSATGLDLTTGYSYVAFATNASGTTYTAVDTFTTTATLATLSAPTATNVTATRARISGILTNDGGSTVTSFGYVYAKTADDPTPQIGEANVSRVVVLGGAIGNGTSFSNHPLIGLQPATQYSLSLYATNSTGTSYSTTITFTTLVAAPTVTTPTQANVTFSSATLGGNVTADNGAAITERGILLAKTSVNNNPQLNGNGVTKIVATGTTGVFTVDATGLDLSTGYSYVAFATNAEGTTYTAVDTFTTLATLASLDLPVAVNIQATSALVGGVLPNTGGSTVTEFGYVYAKTADDPTPQLGEANVTKVAVITVTINLNASFTRLLSGLEPATQYSLTTYAINSVGTSYSTTITFTTLAAAPTVTTPTQANVTSSSATLGGNVTTDNGAAITERGILLAKTSVNNNPQLNGNGVTKLVATGTTGVFTVDALGLDPATGYSYVAFATNSVGTTYSTVDTFTTVGLPPTVTAPTASNVTLTGATLGGNVTSDGQVAITERGIVYSITALNSNPQIGGASVTQVTTDGTTGVFTIDVTALPTGTQISYAAYATNSVGTTYTTVGTFTTQPAIGQFPGITVQILGGQMIVTGTEQDDTIKVATDGMGGYIVTANKLINGLPSPQSFSGATSFVANTLGGHDDLWLAAPLTLDDVTVDLGNGNDRLVLGADPSNAINNNVLDPQFGTLGYLTVNGPVNVIGGEGNDRVIERSTNINGVKTINLGEGNNEYNVYWGFSNETIFSSGAGTDNVYIGYLSSREASQFDTGAGNDLISYYASRFYKTAYLNSGAGADTVALDVNIYDEATTVDTGSEADYLLFSRSVAYKSVVLTTAAGADTVLIGKYISGLGSNGAPIYSNGGSNIDDLTLNTGVEADTVQVAANVMRMFFANLGDAYDDAEVEYNLFTDGFLDGGGQDMRLRLRGNAGLRTRNPSVS